MAFHFVIIAAQCAALTAFLILWYFWIKRRVEAPDAARADAWKLGPFRSFAWLLLGLVFITCALQIHFVRVSATVHERLAAMSDYCRMQEDKARSLDEIKVMVERLRRDMDTNFQGLRAQTAKALQAKAIPALPDMSAARADSADDTVPVRRRDLRAAAFDAGFGKEARSSSSPVARPRPASKYKKTSAANPKTYSMQLSRMGRIIQDDSPVKKRPISGSPVLEHLAAGQEVKVTEKRLLNEEMWFRVVTPTGHAGWVDYRNVKLGRNS